MLNKEKVILMTRLSIQANKLEKIGTGINEYYRGDYVGFGILKSAIVATILYGMLVGIYAAFNFNELLDTFYEGGIVPVLTRMVLYYFVVLVLYVIIAYIVYTLRFTRAHKKARSYYVKLKKLDNLNRGVTGR